MGKDSHLNLGREATIDKGKATFNRDDLNELFNIYYTGMEVTETPEAKNLGSSRITNRQERETEFKLIHLIKKLYVNNTIDKIDCTKISHIELQQGLKTYKDKLMRKITIDREYLERNNDFGEFEWYSRRVKERVKLHMNCLYTLARVEKDIVTNLSIYEQQYETGSLKISGEVYRVD